MKLPQETENLVLIITLEYKYSLPSLRESYKIKNIEFSLMKVKQNEVA